MTEEFQLFHLPQRTPDMGFDQLTEVCLEATPWQYLASIDIMTRHKAILEAKINRVNAKKEGIQATTWEPDAILYRLMIYGTILQIASGRVELFKDFVDENILDISGEAARRRSENCRGLLPLYSHVLSGVEQTHPKTSLI
jgi:hypothetical protein